MTRRVVFNGKFLTAAPTGVHRVAGELILSLDRLLAGGPEAGWRGELVCPPDVVRSFPLDNIGQAKKGPLVWQFWEQFQLPLACRRQLLVNLCNLAPIAVEGAITMIHDAQVFISPESYSRGFGSWYRFALPQIGARAFRILTVSNFSRGRLAAYGVAPLSAISVIHNGVDHILRVGPDEAVLDRLGLTRGEYVVALANTQKHKNIGLLLETFRRPAMKRLRLVLVGAADAAAFAAEGFEPPDNVVFAGRVSDAEMRALLEQAVCLAFPSTTEGFGLPPLEAMALGTPAVVAPCGALPEVCGDAAVYAAPHDPAAWEAELLALADDPAHQRRVGQAAQRHASQYTWERAARELLGVIDEAVAQV
jgi:glycosyltransferase involved in cell wall biosynthesis